MKKVYNVCYRENEKLKKIPCADYEQAQKVYDEKEKAGFAPVFVWEV